MRCRALPAYTTRGNESVVSTTLHTNQVRDCSHSKQLARPLVRQKLHAGPAQGAGGPRPPVGSAARRHRGRAAHSCRVATGLRRAELEGPPGVALDHFDLVCKIFLSCNCSIITERIKPTRRIYNVETPQRLAFNAEWCCKYICLFVCLFGEERLFRGKKTAVPHHCPPNITPVPGTDRCRSARRGFSLGFLAASENDS